MSVRKSRKEKIVNVKLKSRTLSMSKFHLLKAVEEYLHRLKLIDSDEEVKEVEVSLDH